MRLFSRIAVQAAIIIDGYGLWTRRQFFPPGDFIAGLMELAVMAPAERYGEFVADFDSECARLLEAKMVRVARVATANEAPLGKPQNAGGIVAPALGFG